MNSGVNSRVNSRIIENLYGGAADHDFEEEDSSFDDDMDIGDVEDEENFFNHGIADEVAVADDRGDDDLMFVGNDDGEEEDNAAISDRYLMDSVLSNNGVNVPLNSLPKLSRHRKSDLLATELEGNP